MGSERPPIEMLAGEMLIDILLKIAFVSSHLQHVKIVIQLWGYSCFKHAVTSENIYEENEKRMLLLSGKL
jgi:hypothetical protein